MYLILLKALHLYQSEQCPLVLIFVVHHLIFPLWSELEFLKSVKGKSDYQRDFTLLISRQENMNSFFLVPQVFITLD